MRLLFNASFWDARRRYPAGVMARPGLPLLGPSVASLALAALGDQQAKLDLEKSRD